MPNFFINMIILLFQDAAIYVNINNQTTNPFELHRGIRQGFLLVPYSFIIVADALNVAVKHAMRYSELQGITLPQCNSQQIINQYVDDILFAVRENETSVDKFVGILHKFELAFGLEINWHKCVTY